MSWLVMLSLLAAGQETVVLKGVCRTSEGKPAAGVEIVLGRVDAGSGGRVVESAYHTRTFVGKERARTTTGADGTFSFAGLEKGVYHLSPAPLGDAVHEDFPERLVRLEADAEVALAGKRAGRWIVGRGKPGARIDLWDPLNHRVLKSEAAGADGEARFFVHDGDPALRVAAPEEKFSVAVAAGTRGYALAEGTEPAAFDASGAAVLQLAGLRWWVALDGVGVAASGELKNGARGVQPQLEERKLSKVRVVASHEDASLGAGVTAMLLRGARVVLSGVESPLLRPSAEVAADGTCALALKAGAAAEVWATGERRGGVPIFKNMIARGTLVEESGAWTCRVDLRALIEGQVPPSDDRAVRLELLAEAFAREAGGAERASFELLSKVCRLVGAQR